MEVSLVPVDGDMLLEDCQGGSNNSIVYGSQWFFLLPYSKGEIYALSFETKCWHKKETQGGGPSARIYHATALVGNKMYVICGEDEAGEPFHDVWYINLDDFRWTKVEITMHSEEDCDCPGGGYLQAVYSNGTLYVADVASNKMWSLEFEKGAWNYVWRGDEHTKIQNVVGNNNLLLGFAPRTDKPNFVWTLRWVEEDATWEIINSCTDDINNELCGCQQMSSVLLSGSTQFGYFYLHPSDCKWHVLIEPGDMPELASLSENVSVLYNGVVYVMGFDIHYKLAMGTIRPKEPLLRGPARVVDDLSVLFDSPYADFKIIPKEGADHAVPAVKAILAARWGWFDTLLKSGMQEVQSGTVHVPKGRDVVVALLRFLYTGSLLLPLPSKTLIGLAKLANMYQMHELHIAVREALYSLLSEANCIKVFMCGVKIQDKKLIKLAAASIVDNLQVVIVRQSEEFTNLIANAEAKEALAPFLPLKSSNPSSKRKRDATE